MISWVTKQTASLRFYQLLRYLTKYHPLDLSRDFYCLRNDALITLLQATHHCSQSPSLSSPFHLAARKKQELWKWTCAVQQSYQVYVLCARNCLRSANALAPLHHDKALMLLLGRYFALAEQPMPLMISAFHIAQSSTGSACQHFGSWCIIMSLLPPPPTSLQSILPELYKHWALFSRSAVHQHIFPAKVFLCTVAVLSYCCCLEVL